MKHINIALFAGSILFVALITGCGSTPVVNQEASTSAIRVAEGSRSIKRSKCISLLQLARNT